MSDQSEEAVVRDAAKVEVKKVSPPPAPKTADQKFVLACSFTKKWEGGFSDHPSDLGGATFRGVTQATYNSYRDRVKRARQSVQKMTNDEFLVIYREGYWEPLHCDLWVPALAVCLFDFSINSGPSRAGRALQSKAGGLTIDGVVGPKTIARVKTLDQVDLADRIVDYREAFFRQIVANNPSQKVFQVGWQNRIDDLRRYLKSIKHLK